MLRFCISCGNYDFAVDLSTGSFSKDCELAGRLDDFCDFIEDCISPVCLHQGNAKGQTWKIVGSTELISMNNEEE